MIYLIKTEFKNLTLLKIGYAVDVNNRMKAYRTHNPLVELLDTREGELDLEMYLHKYFKEFAYPDQPEWFYYNEKIVKEFKSIDIGFTLEEFLKRLKEYLLSPVILRYFKLSYVKKYGDSEYINNLITYISRLKNIEFDISGDINNIDYGTSIYIENIPFDSITLNINLELKDIIDCGKLSYFQSSTSKEIHIKLKDDYKNITNEEFIFINNTVSQFYSLDNNFYYRMKFICETLSMKDNSIQLKIINELPKSYQEYYITLGPERIKALGYNFQRLKDDISQVNFDINILNNTIYNNFQVGEKYSNAAIKIKLQDLYNQLGYKKTAKASDIEQWFEINAIQYRDNGKRIHGFEIVKKK